MKDLRSFKGRTGADETDKLLSSLGISREAFDRYSRYDEDGLIRALTSSVRAAKRAGTFDPAQMDAFIAAVSPMLSPRQREKLHSVVEVIEIGDI